MQSIVQRTILIGKLLTVSVLLMATFMFIASASTSAQQIQRNVNCGGEIGLGSASGCNKPGPNKGSGPLETLIKNIINVFSAIVGAICVVMIIIGGFRYVTSGGDSNSVSGAKNTILYAIVGLIIVAFAQIIVQFVLQRTT